MDGSVDTHRRVEINLLLKGPPFMYDTCNQLTVVHTCKYRTCSNSKSAAVGLKAAAIYKF